MSRPIRFNRLLVTGLVAVAAALACAQAAHAGPTAPSVPPEVRVDAEVNKVFLIGHAVGVQIYSCTATSDGFVWRFVAPRADLYDDNGKLIITHFGGPTWQAKDGSKVVGKLVQPLIVDETAIPWLLLSTPSPIAGPDGGDRLVPTTFIQRIATTGGVAPDPATCNATTVTTVAEVPYTADYVFWKKTAV